MLMMKGGGFGSESPGQHQQLMFAADADDARGFWV